MTKIIVSFRNFAKAPDEKKETLSINCHKFTCYTKITVDEDKRLIIFTALLLLDQLIRFSEKLYISYFPAKKRKRLFGCMINGTHVARFFFKVDNYSDYEFVVMFDPYSTGMNIDMHRGLYNR
jgi:hypothetical protein